MFLGEFPENLLFKAFFAKCLRQKCEYVVPRALLFFFFNTFKFLFFTPHVRHFKHVLTFILSMFSGFEVSRGGFFVCFWGNFRIFFFF